MSRQDDDIVREFINRCMAAVPGFSVEIAERIETEVRRDFGGDRYYIAKSIHVERRKDIVLRELVNGATPKEIQRKHGISRSSIYRLIAKR